MHSVVHGQIEKFRNEYCKECWDVLVLLLSSCQKMELIEDAKSVRAYRDEVETLKVQVCAVFLHYLLYFLLVMGRMLCSPRVECQSGEAGSRHHQIPTESRGCRVSEKESRGMLHNPWSVSDLQLMEAVKTMMYQLLTILWVVRT